jgi:hypothetical protein
MPRHNGSGFPSHAKGRIATEVRHAPHTGYDPNNPGMYPRLHWTTQAALERCVRGTSWSDHLLLASIVLAAHNWPPWRILAAVATLHGYLLTLLRSHALSEIEEWDVDHQYDEDLGSSRLVGRERETRVTFWEHYQDISWELLQWIENLPNAEQRIYRPFLLPFPTRGTTRSRERRVFYSGPKNLHNQHASVR